ncbi:hypothetical protein M422DRAFT_46941 [Sphaerobolus stellatus SS14]|uniref:Uncharacterized protein n=1 Tax=Sphaerobolus stellatus (strain SS14) TaxID=990650 RepID=A0A0C9W0Z1_SPHS4|nr:hypothetical protein M422DRAFT_46941 [Sphaerobolus stellatus SS14]
MMTLEKWFWFKLLKVQRELVFWQFFSKIEMLRMPLSIILDRNIREAVSSVCVGVMMKSYSSIWLKDPDSQLTSWDLKTAPKQYLLYVPSITSTLSTSFYPGENHRVALLSESERYGTLKMVRESELEQESLNVWDSLLAYSPYPFPYVYADITRPAPHFKKRQIHLELIAVPSVENLSLSRPVVESANYLQHAEK